MEAEKAESGDMENIKHKFLESNFLQDDQRLSGRCIVFCRIYCVMDSFL